MKVSEIPIPKHPASLTTKSSAFLKKAPRLLASVINDAQVLGSIHSLDDLRPEYVHSLSGGVDAAAYLIYSPNERVVIKFNTHGLEAEAEAIRTWRKHHVRTPNILGVGIVPSTKKQTRPIKYLAQEALVDSDGRAIETCAQYLIRDPSHARQVGRALGKELHKIHSCISDGWFGEFGDVPGSSSSYKTWNAYIRAAIERHKAYLRDSGIPDTDIQAMLMNIDRHRYIKRGRYLHGDFSTRNVAVKSYSPLKISVFDPNPLIGDPTWDVSFLINNVEYAKRRLVHDETHKDIAKTQQQLWVGFKQSYARKINEFSLMSAQFVQAIYQAHHAESIGDSLGLKVRKEFLRELASAMCA